MKDRFSDGGAKKLAGYFGIFFVVVLSILHSFGYREISFIVGAIFITCSLLDAFINYCVGCKIYFIIKKIYPDFMS